MALCVDHLRPLGKYGEIMARYSCSFYSENSLDTLLSHLDTVLQACNFEIIYRNDEYVVGRENPGHVKFTKLVTVEALVDYQSTASEKVHLNCILKNEELPLSTDNHCRKVFDHVCKNIQDKTLWQLQ